MANIASRFFFTALFSLLAATAARGDSDRKELVGKIDAALAKAGRYLLERQSADGAWRSETYGCFRDGPTLTPYVMSGLLFLPQAGPRADAAFHKGADYLAAMVDPSGKLRVGPRELMFPVYTAALAGRIVVRGDHGPKYLRAQQAWLAYLRGRQLNEALGWNPEDPQYGGWGFSIGVPRKPAKGEFTEPFFESNLAATVFALGALRSAKAPGDDSAYRQALVLVERCQNFSNDPAAGDPRFDDGGFFFIPGDAAQNKAGPAGKDRHGRQRFRSYGTMTADGLRALIRCGLPPDHPRVKAAAAWLERNFSAAANPGDFPADRAVLQNATYYYWTWAAAHALLAIEKKEVKTPKGVVQWPKVLAEELLPRQRPDGAWVNRYTDAKEDDPLVATPWAAAALAISRAILTGENPRPGDGCPMTGKFQSK